MANIPNNEYCAVGRQLHKQHNGLCCSDGQFTPFAEHFLNCADCEVLNRAAWEQLSKDAASGKIYTGMFE